MVLGIVAYIRLCGNRSEAKARMNLRVLYLVVPVFVLGMGLVGLTVSGNADEFPSIVIFLAMAISLLSALTILSIRHNSGLNRFIVGGDDNNSSSLANIVNG